ncbi:MAG: carbohydrate ABC transporter permease [Treponema sp.]|jgi:multiple sugar transport system permease protein/cellobiose transport system permease protein|nr:carbohydrate ABC transporter permease [Treponema sp.]
MNTRKIRIANIPVYAFLLFCSLLSLFPFYIMLIMGTYKNEDLFRGLRLLPGSYIFENIKTIMATDFPLYYRNSLLVATGAAVGALLLSSLTGYAFAKFRFRGKNILFFFILGSIMVPPQVGLVGFVTEMRWFGLVNTFFPLIIPAWASAFGVFWMRQYISATVPNELLESAKIDGSNTIHTFVFIVMPVIRPALITLFLLFFLWNWNDYLLPLIILNNQKLITIPLSISLIGQLYRNDYAARILSLAAATIPILILFIAGSKYLIKGLVTGSVKG